MKKVLLGLVGIFLVSCSSSAPATFTITQPSEYETNYAELRDFYVIGSYPSGVTMPGNIKIELFRGGSTNGVPIRTIQSSVDNETCLTPESSLDTTYPNGNNYGITMVPDIVKEPGGILNPNNKVVVTSTYFAGLILGGATKDFDTTYEDSQGNPLEDLTAGTYTIKVTGLSCDTYLMTTTKQITFGLTHASLGRFTPASSLAKLTAFTRENNYRIYLDNFPGYFNWLGKLYEIKSRWMPNNSIEVVNDLSGTTIDTVSAAVNDMLIYNVKPTSATKTIEIGALAKNELTESLSTVWHYYDIGEPSITYVDSDGATQTLDGSFDDFAEDDRLVLIRAEVQTDNGTDEENIYNVADMTPKTLDFDFSDGVTATTADEVAFFGVVRPIPSEVTNGTHDHEYIVDNSIDQVVYTIKNASGTVVSTSTHDVYLGRIYDASAPTTITYSSYEFKSDFSLGTIPLAAGDYTIEMVGLDTNGAEVDGTSEIVDLTVN